jgi:hypothetical protein
MVGYRLVLLVLKGPIELHWTLDWSCLVSFDGCRSHTLTSNHQNRLTAAASEDSYLKTIQSHSYIRIMNYSPDTFVDGDPEETKEPLLEIPKTKST